MITSAAFSPRSRKTHCAAHWDQAPFNLTEASFENEVPLEMGAGAKRSGHASKPITSLATVVTARPVFRSQNGGCALINYPRFTIGIRFAVT